MFSADKRPYLVPFDGSFTVSQAETSPPKHGPDKGERKRQLAELVEELSELQRVLYADDRYAVLLIFQALDAAGKDGTIRAVLTGVNPAGCHVTPFKAPSTKELDHDFLWRTSSCLPERGTIGVFNRSYYEEVLVVRVHPELLVPQRLPRANAGKKLWEERYRSIRDHERHLSENGTVIMKFWLNVSKKEQKERFLSRIEEPEKNWKFSTRDVAERQYWKEYMQAYEEALNETSRPWAPWYAIPADDKPFMRLSVARIIVDNLKTLKIGYPEMGRQQTVTFADMRDLLQRDDKE